MTMMKTIRLLFWYSVDTTETSVRNKTMFGGVKGKFNGLELFREGRGGGGGERWRMEDGGGLVRQGRGGLFLGR